MRLGAGARRARGLECERNGVSRALSRERVSGVRSHLVEGACRARGVRLPEVGCCLDSRMVRGRCKGCAELELALRAELASALPQVNDVGGPGDLMETKVKENNFRKNRGGPEVLGRLEGYVAASLGSHPSSTLAAFLLLFLLLPLPPRPGVVPSRHSGCFGAIPELSVCSRTLAIF